MALGANDVILEELATAYGTFITGGIKPETFFVQKIVDPKGNLVEEHQDPHHKYLISYSTVEEDEKRKKEKAKGGAESKPSPETQPTSATEKTPEGYNIVLWDKAQKFIQQDQLLLTDHEKQILYGNYIPEGYTISPKTAVTMVSILQDVVRAGTGTRALALKKPAAGKTGTTNGETDAWFMGFTPNLMTGVWVGFDEKIKSLPRGSTGGSTAAPIWLAYMQEATKKYPTQSFNIPDWVDLSVYESPVQVVINGGDAELGDTGVGTGTAGSGTQKSGGSSGGAEFFSKDLE